jgi:hypothetical protein
MRAQRRCKTLTIQESFGTLGLKVTRDLDEIWLHNKSACAFSKGGNERAVLPKGTHARARDTVIDPSRGRVTLKIDQPR